MSNEVNVIGDVVSSYRHTARCSYGAFDVENVVSGAAADIDDECARVLFLTL